MLCCVTWCHRILFTLKVCVLRGFKHRRVISAIADSSEGPARSLKLFVCLRVSPYHTQRCGMVSYPTPTSMVYGMVWYQSPCRRNMSRLKPLYIRVKAVSLTPYCGGGVDYFSYSRSFVLVHANHTASTSTSLFFLKCSKQTVFFFLFVSPSVMLGVKGPAPLSESIIKLF